MFAIAIAYVGAAASQPDLLADYEAAFPWATANQTADLPGSPGCEGEIVALYWQALWDRLRDEPLADPILATWPADGAYEHPVAAEAVEARVSVAFARGLHDADVGPEDFTVADETGATWPVDVDVFYGHASHVVHLIPRSDWPADRDLTVTIAPGIRSFDGESLDGASFSFSTRHAPEAVGPAAPATVDRGCGCDAATTPISAWWLALLAGVRRRRTA